MKNNKCSRLVGFLSHRVSVEMLLLTWPRRVISFSKAILSAAVFPPSNWITHVLEYAAPLHVAKVNIEANKNSL